MRLEASNGLLMLSNIRAQKIFSFSPLSSSGIPGYLLSFLYDLTKTVTNA